MFWGYLFRYLSWERPLVDDWLEKWKTGQSLQHCSERNFFSLPNSYYVWIIVEVIFKAAIFYRSEVKDKFSIRKNKMYLSKAYFMFKDSFTQLSKQENCAVRFAPTGFEKAHTACKLWFFLRLNGFQRVLMMLWAWDEWRKTYTFCYVVDFKSQFFL